MRIIAEGGATKTDWRAVTSGGIVLSVVTGGVNVATSDPDYNEAAIRRAVSSFAAEGEPVTEIHFYAAGLVPDGNPVPQDANNIDRIFRKAFPDAEIEYASDLLDSARALFGHDPGIAVILGTGSNSCEYDGERIVKNVRSGGYILGDEGGAASLGRMFLSDFLKGLVPEPLYSEFSSEYKADYLTVVNELYHGQSPARYLGSFAPFITAAYYRSQYAMELVDNNFRRLFTRCLSQYDNSGKRVGVTGGFGYAMRDVLRKIAVSEGYEISEVISSPVDRLLKYHFPEI